MKGSLPAVRISTGVTVRLDGRPHLVGPLNENGRVFTDKESGTERHFSLNAIRRMVCAARITTDAAWRLLDANVMAALEIDWGAYTETEQQSALRKVPFVKAIHDLPRAWRHLRKHVQPVLDRMAADPENAGSPKPNFRLARTWYVRWSITGPDIRALVDMNRHKGNRTKRQEDWVMEEVYKAIDETYRNELLGSMAEAARRARDRVILRARVCQNSSKLRLAERFVQV
jgi:putative transposase